ncbi:MAG: hypothetical protein K6L73_05080 [Cellvibrionaceae bacterium]
MLTQQASVRVLWLFLFVSFASGVLGFIEVFCIPFFNAGFYFGTCIFLCWMLLNPDVGQLTSSSKDKLTDSKRWELVPASSLLMISSFFH